MKIMPFFTEFRFTLALRKVILFSLIVGIYTLFPLLVHYYGFFVDVEIISTGLEAFMGIVLSLLLVFRANRAYERWWEARTQWGILVNVSRNLALKIKTYVKPGKEDAQYFAYLISQFSFALLRHLRGITNQQALSTKLDIPDSVNNLPVYICGLIYEKLENLKENGKLTEIQFLIIDTDLSQFMHVCGACEKIKHTLISLSYRSFVHHIMVILFLFLPWQLANNYKFWAIPLIFLIAYITFALEGIARNLEEPFGLSSDDVHMETISQTITKSARQILITN